MEVVALSRFVRISPRKVRLVAEHIKTLNPKRALEVLSVLKKEASEPLRKTLKSAMANAVKNFNLIEENLRIKKIEIGEGGAFKRSHPKGRGRTSPYKKRMSHIKIILEDKDGTKS